ncbi:MAG TPA: hypothetical protein VGF69_22570 [Thermoanaerobaculia bacterium]|jgi:hypothetical protein
MTTIPDVPSPTPADDPANKYTPDAQERMTRLRSMAEEFPDEADPKPLTSADIRLARGTSVTTLENVAILVEAAPALNEVGDVVELRDAIAFELAYGGVRDEARALARRIDLAILRRKLKASKTARGLYRVAKGYVTLDAGDAVRPHVTEIRRSLAPRRRRKPAAAAELKKTAEK